MEATIISNEVRIKKDGETSLKGKAEECEEEKRVIHVLEETQGEDNSKNASGERKDEQSRKIDGSKRTRIANPKTNVTVPRPFNLATDKRMTIERRGSMNLKEPKPILTKSASFHHRPSNLKGAETSSIKTSLKPKIRTNEKDDKNMEGKTCQANAKNTRNENPIFKALPLPNFYRQKDLPPKSETKKTVAGCSKPPVIGDLVNALPKSGNNKIEGNTRRVSRGMSGGEKETTSKVIKTTKLSLRTTPKESVKKLVQSDGK
ncbi:hypothetical protein L2E82_06156 [Cichorium intybus]|uniref:Uncharacterized protein n=1 Tax=Cichorium intybus TaxID=13427 RepID=A0ACB9HAK5_CICIN|nr:hypothetical protein L2E82_06156 [Cichorium intybus]